MAVAAFVAVLHRRGGRCPCCAGRRRGFVQFSDKVVTCPLLRRQVHGGVAGAVPVVVDVPVIMQRRGGLAHSGGASDSCHRAVLGLSGCATETGTHSAKCAPMGGFFRPFQAIFRAPPGRLELSASF